MRYASLLLSLLCALLLGGCMAAVVAGAGAAAQSDEDIDYYLKTNEVDSTVAEAMRDRKLTEGMSPAQVRLTMGARSDYTAHPDNIEETESGERWLYENRDPMTTATYEVIFEDGAVTTYGYVG